MGEALDDIRKRAVPLENVADAGEVVAYRVDAEDFAWLLTQAGRAEALARMLDDARAEVERLRAALAELDEEEVWRLACLCGEPAHALDGRMRVLLVRRVLADRRQRAGVTP